MGTKWAGILVSLFILLCFTPLAWGVVGTLNVNLRDAATGQPVAGAKVKLTPATPGLPEKDGETDEKGIAIFFVEAGTYHVTFQRPGADLVVSPTMVTVRGGETTSTDVSASIPPPKRFRVKLEGGAIWQRRELDEPFIISEAVERFILGAGARSTVREQQKVNDLDERGRLDLILVKLMYQLTDRIEVHAQLGTGRLVTRLDNLSGHLTVTETVNSLPSSSTAFPFGNSDRHEGDGTNGFAGGVGFNAMLYQVPVSHLSLIFGAQWLYIQSDDILKIADGAAIDESRTHMIDTNLMARQQWGRLTVEAGIGTTWMLTVYRGYFTKREEFFDFTAPDSPFTTTTGRKRFSFEVTPEAFPIVGRLGFEYALTDSIGIQAHGAAGNSHTYSVLGEAFWRF